MASGSRVIRATQYLRASPNTSMWLAYGHIAMNRPSIAGGTTYLPLEVLNISLSRPVIRRNPSASSSPLSPVRSQPSGVNASAVLSGRLW
jgi:hypothetical protein